MILSILDLDCVCGFKKAHGTGASKRAFSEKVQVLATNLEGLTLIPGTHRVEIKKYLL